MRIPLLFRIVFFFVTEAQAQHVFIDSLEEAYLPMQFSATHLSPERAGEAGLSAEGYVRSNAIKLPFSFAVLRNEFIDEEMKDASAKNLHVKNVLEEGYEMRFYYNWSSDRLLYKDAALYSVDYSFGSYTSSWFTEELFNTVFYGNAYYAGDTADFGGTRSYIYEYDRIGFSVRKKFSGQRSLWETGIRLSLLGIHSASHLDMNQAWLYTEMNGEYLDAGYDFEYSVSDTTNHGSWQIDGFGPAIDLMTTWSSAGGTVQVIGYVNNLGSIFWNGETNTYAADSSIRYEGIEADNLLSLDDSSAIQYNVDSLLKYTGTRVTRGSKAFPLPLCLAGVVNYRLSDQWVLQGGLSYRPYPDLFPAVFAKPRWIPASHFEAGAIVSFGGTSGFALGFELETVLARRILLAASSENILGLFMPDQSTSASLFLQASVKF